MKSSCCNVLCTDYNRLVDNRVFGLVEAECSCRKLAWGRVRLTRVCSIKWWMEILSSLYVFVLTFYVFYVQSKEGFPVNDMGDIPCGTLGALLSMTRWRSL